MGRITDFSHLHNHTTYSPLDGASTVHRLLKRAADYDMGALAITDHGFLYGLPEFQSVAEGMGIKPILGVEAYLVTDYERMRKEKDKTGRSPYHQIVIAKNQTGLRNLTKLISSAATDCMYYGRPIIDLKRLAAHRDGLIVTSSCMSGIIPKAIRDDNMERALLLSEWFRSRFGDDFYLEVHDHGIEEEAKVRVGIKYISETLGIKVICANDIHYVNPEDYELQKAIIFLKFKGKIDSSRDPAMYAHERLHFTTPKEMQNMFGKEFPESLVNTKEIVDKCDARIDLKSDFILPPYSVPDRHKDADAFLLFLCDGKVDDVYEPERRDEARARLIHELTIIKDLNFSQYFLIVQDLVQAAKQMKVVVGPGRGSAGGSIVAYLLGITAIDPLKHGLLFERFLNPGRKSMPDIDIDFDDVGREHVFAYLEDKYGKDSVKRIITFSTVKTSVGVRDMARYAKLPISQTNKLADYIPKDASEKEFSKTFVNDSRVKSWASRDNRVAETINMAQRYYGLVRQTGVHACGVIVTPGPVTDYVPIMKTKTAGSEIEITQYEQKYLEKMGLLKIDLLGLRTLSVIKATIGMLDDDLDIGNIPMKDSKTIKLLRAGNTSGVFQLESEGMKAWLRDLQPDSFEDIVAMVALYRPGPMGLLSDYVNRKHGRERVIYPHKKVRSILKPTYGIPVYQEQVMQMAQAMAGFSMAEADDLRRAMGKKIESEMDKMHDRFINGSVDNGVDRNVAIKVFDMIAKFAGYGFNKSHAVAYAMLAYQTAYLKANYPVEFMTAQLINAKDADTQSAYIDEARQMSIFIRPPDINSSNEEFTAAPEKRSIFIGTNAIKFVGSDASIAIRQERERAPFTSLDDFMKRMFLREDAVVTWRDVKSLIDAGCFDSLGDRAALAHKGYMLLGLIKKKKDYLFGTRKSDVDLSGADEELSPEPMPNYLKAQREYELMGLFVSGTPMDGLEPIIKLVEVYAGASNASEEFIQSGDLRYRPLIGCIVDKKEKKIKNGRNAGQTFAEVHLMVNHHIYKIVAWPEVYQKYEGFLEKWQKVFIAGGIRRFDKDPKNAEYEVLHVMPLEKVLADWTRGIYVRAESYEDIKPLIDAMPEGNQKVVYFCHDANGCHYDKRLDMNYLIRLKEASTHINLF